MLTAVVIDVLPKTVIKRIFNVLSSTTVHMNRSGATINIESVMTSAERYRVRGGE